MAETILVEGGDGIFTVTVNRPDKLNALNKQVVDELTHAFEDLAAKSARVAILTGAGQKAFVAGADIAEMSALSAVQAKAFADAGHKLGYAIENAPFPVIAAVNGFALGGGCELALACDFIYAADTARFGQPEVNLGLMPGFGGTQRLSRRVGPARARELVYTADMVKADAALAMGLVNAVVPAAELLEKVRAVAEKIASKAPIAVASSKRVMVRAADADLPLANELEATAFGALFDSEDMREGTRAFVEKRAAKFQGK
ncbi:MAG: enoyl-CoA hydratase/isomerase family protein [Myxococcales bacterium]|nr:enoyl-CoA hydratase/isomerase family protein [Myxococcales bacterium]MCB9576368.1 enoyl-CoA hydratase/isomerase family protein [Polyangiaceae bacterium]